MGEIFLYIGLLVLTIFGTIHSIERNMPGVVFSIFVISIILIALILK